MKRLLPRLNPFYWLPRQIALIAYVAFWLLVYVATQYRAEMKVRRFYQLKRALSEKRATYLELNAAVSEQRRYSTLKPVLDSLRLHLPKNPPYVLPIREATR